MAQAHSLKSWHRHTAWSHGTGTQPEVMAQAHSLESWHRHTAWSHGTGTQPEVMAQAHSLKSWHRHTAWSHGTGTQPEVMAQAHSLKSWHRHTAWSHGTGTQPEVMAQAHSLKSWHRHTTSSHGTGTKPQVMMCVCMCVCMRACAHVCGVQWIQYYVHIMIIFGFNAHIFVDLVKGLVSEIWHYRNDHYYYDALACTRKVMLACSVTKLCYFPIGLNCINIWVDWQRGTGVWYRPVHTMTEVDSCGRAERSRPFCPACICHQSVQHSAHLHGTCQEPVVVYCLCQSHQLATHQYAGHGLGSTIVKAGWVLFDFFLVNSCLDPPQQSPLAFSACA